MCSLYVIILILGFITGAYMETCPEERDIYPCTCIRNFRGWLITVICSRGSFNTSYPLKILQQALSSLKEKNATIQLQFKNSDISIPSNFFDGISIQYLLFESCRVYSFGNDDQMLTGLENHLQELRIENSVIVPPKLNLGHLKNLTAIIWSGSNIMELTDDWLSFSYSLQHLRIYGSNITKIGSYAFYHLISLRYLQLNDNNFGPLKRTMFPRKADNLRFLDLRNNALTDLPVDLFSKMPSIETIHLQRNKITTLDERTWSPVWQQLHSVLLQDNKIVCNYRLKWISKTKKMPKDFKGECSAPKKYEGKDLKKFLRRQKQ